MIRIHELARHYGDFAAVERVSFEIGKGEIVGLLGHNGAGKSDQTGSGKLDVVFEFSLTLNSGGKRDYRFTQSPGAKDYLLQSSDQPWSFRVAPYTLDNIRSATRSKLVAAPATVPQDAMKPGDTSARRGLPENRRLSFAVSSMPVRARRHCGADY